MYANYIKRLIDVAVTLLMMPLFVILTALVSPLIYFEDKGPVFFRQTRRGIRGGTFRIYKFRTMKVNAPDIRTSDGSTYTGSNDPRVTRIGQILRQTSLDEIPQIINVLLGDMSLIGPRPTLATEDYAGYSPVKKKRLEVRPGITGYSQAYYRNSISADEKFVRDAYYADHVSFRLDLKIIWMTVLSVVQRKDINANDPNS